MTPRSILAPLRNWRRLLDLGLLYASKSGALIVGVFILPWYQRLLGADSFGAVAMVLSLQAFLLMLDLGTSTLVGRDVAATDDSQAHQATWHAAELLLHIFYAGLLVVALIANTLCGAPLPTIQIVLCIIFFWSLTVHNVGQSALLAKRRYASSGCIQISGVLGRAAVSLAALTYIKADLTTFFVAQAATGVAQMIVTSWICRKALGPASPLLDRSAILRRTKELAYRGKPLVLFGLSGAAVLQLDKAIIPVFISPAALTPYFLASALCLTPISVLAGPINQFFFPSIIGSISKGDTAQASAQLQKLVFAICVAVAIPSAVLWLGREPIVNIWLHHQPIAFDVIRYVEILLPGIALGALGYVPYNILVAHQDYRAHAGLSLAMTTATLLATALGAAWGSVMAVCWIYAGYHSMSAAVTWFRAHQLEPASPENYATRSATYALKQIAGIAIIVAVLHAIF